MSDRRLTPQELNAWHAVTRHVVPLRGSQKESSGQEVARVMKPESMPASAPKQTRKKPSVPQQQQNHKRIRRGQQTYSAVLDLHGHSLKSGWRILPSFLRRWQNEGAQCVLIITGKGKDGEGVLRRTFLHWLETREAGVLVSHYAQAHPAHGGAGAWYVFLRR